jgi:hypothetical protein
MYCQMIRVISSPSSSTTGFWTLIFAMGNRAFFVNLSVSGRAEGLHSIAKAAAKASRAASLR